MSRSIVAALEARYTIDREIGRGGMATVYLARDLKHERNVALKVLHPDLAAALGAERFLAEIRTTANLQHPHILPLHDSGEADGYLFYVMPFVTGETLRARLERENVLPIDDALRISREVLSALDYAHRHGVVHRDIKPENILLHDGSALVADFGIALAVQSAGGQRMTQTGLSLGTPQYMSPEQAMGERQIDGRADVYAMGAVLYEMLTGEPPFSGASVQAIVAKVLTERPMSPRTVRDTVPANVEAAVMRALAKLPADRFTTAARFNEALGDGRKTDAVDTPMERNSVRGDSTAWRAGAIGSSAVAAVAIAAAMWSSAGKRAAAPAVVQRFELPLHAQLPDSGSTFALSYFGATLAISNDGSRIVYVGRDSLGATQVWVREMGALEPRVVAGTQDAKAVAISPDGGSVAFIANSQLRTVSLRAGTPVTLVPSGARAPFWADDGNVYFSEGGALRLGVGRVAATGGAVKHVLPDARSILDIQVLPGGRALVARQAGNAAAVARIVAVSFSDRKVHDLAPGTHPVTAFPGYVVYTTGGGVLMALPFDAKNLVAAGAAVVIDEPGLKAGERVSQFALSSAGDLVYQASDPKAVELTWVTRTGVATPVDTSLPTGVNFPALSPDGKRLAYMLSGSLWIKQLGHGATLKLAGDGGCPAWSADGKFVSYYVQDVEADTLWRKPVDGGGPAELLVASGDPVESLWSSDGRWLVYRTSGNAAGAGDIYAMRVGTDPIGTKIIGTPASEWQPALSPDGRYLAYSSNESGTSEVYVVPFPDASGGRWVLSAHGGSEPLWSHSGKELFFRDANDNLVAVQVRTTPTFDPGASRTLFSVAQYASYVSHREYEISNDDQRFLMLRQAPGAQASSVVLVRNWEQVVRAAVKR